MITNDELNAIRQRAESASPGPWAPGLEVEDGYGLCWIVTPPDGSVLFSVCRIGHRDTPKTKEDAEFIAAAREDIPALLAHIKELETEITDLHEQLERMADAIVDDDRDYAK